MTTPTKFIHFSDLHVGDNPIMGIHPNGWSCRIMDCKQVLMDIAERSMEGDIAFVLFCGDFFNKKNPPSYMVNYFMNVLNLPNFRVRPWYFNIGQHDWQTTPTKHHNLELLSYLTTSFPNFRVMNEAMNLALPESELRIINIPYSERMYYELAEESRMDSAPCILSIHAPIRTFPMHYKKDSDKGFTLDELTKGSWKYIAAGDFHVYKNRLYKGTRIVMSGSVLQTTFGETIEAHGYSIGNLYTNETELVQCEYPKMITIECVPDKLKETLSLFKGPEFIFKFIVPEQHMVSQVREIWQAWKNEYDSYRNCKIQVRTNVENSNLNISDLSKFDVEREMVDSVAGHKDLSAADKTRVMRLGKEVIGEAGI